MKLSELLFELTKNLPMKLIEIDGEPYLERYFVRVDSDGTQHWLHHILRSDPERWLHTHPFNAVSLILVGGYTEERANPDGTTTRIRYAVGARNEIRMETMHRIVSAEPDTWTLMTVSPERNLTWRFVDGRDEYVQLASPVDWHTMYGDRENEYAIFYDEGNVVLNGLLKDLAARNKVTINSDICATKKPKISWLRVIWYTFALLSFCAVVSFVGYGIDTDCPDTAIYENCSK